MIDRPATRATRPVDWREGEVHSPGDNVIVETPVAVVYNGISVAVMMLTPHNLEDFAYGFSLTEGVVRGPDQIRDVAVLESSIGLELQVSIAQEAFFKLKQQRRFLEGRTGCGLCGKASLEQAIARPAPVNAPSVVYPCSALQSASRSLASQQHLYQATAAVHAAACCSRDGEVKLVREDVGRHNALDKLIGAHCRSGLANDSFYFVTSRVSYEMVAKTAAANIALLAAISAPTDYAIDYANSSNITLVGRVAPSRHVVYTHPQRLQLEERLTCHG